MKKIYLTIIILVIIIGAGLGVYVGQSYLTSQVTSRSYCSSNVTSSQVSWYSSTTNGSKVMHTYALFHMNENSAGTICVRYELMSNPQVKTPYIHLFPIFTYTREGPLNKTGSWSTSSNLSTTSDPESYTFQKVGDSVIVSYSIYAPKNTAGYYQLFLSGFCSPFAYLMIGITPTGNNTAPFTMASSSTIPEACGSQEFSTSIVGVSGVSVSSVESTA